jgi:hypothetical protein
VALRLPTRSLTWAILLLWAASIAITVSMWFDGDRAWTHYLPAAVLTIVVLSWPFALGWRPWEASDRRLRTCPSCGTEWRPADEGTTRCPACGA